MSVSAPGKLFLFGECAVLRGAPAVVTTVDRRVVVSPSDTGYSLLGGKADESLPRAVAIACGVDLPGLSVDIRNFYDGDQKLGFGSSAASAVALTSALLDETRPEAVLPIAHRAHRAFQGGRGSGGDVAASTYGGTLMVKGSDDPDAPPAVAPLRWPDGLKVFAVWTSKSANTRDFVDAVRRSGQPLHHLRALAETAVVAFEQGDVERLLVTANDYDDAMGKLGASAGVPIRTNLHRRIAKVVRDFGATAKPSGAGGGDVSLVFAHAQLERAALRAALPKEARLLDVQMSVEGVRRDH